MKLKLITLFLVSSLAGFVSCSESDDPSASTGSGACQIASYSRGTYGFVYTFSSGKQSKTEETYNSNPYYSHKFEYSQNQVKQSSAYISSPSEPITHTPNTTVTLNQQGFPLEIINAPTGMVNVRLFYKDNLVSYSVEQYNGSTVKDSIVYTYDEGKKNIAKIEYYNWQTSNPVWEYSYSESFVYDTKINPFYKMIFREGDVTRAPILFSQNNIISDSDGVYVYNYNEQNYPLTKTASGKTSAETFTYTCK